ncbi:hypothetical protein GGE16_005192 [Rhizobium leguminosarum]|uniref:Uncharacterized protein n=1 Tax=Rhizobium leguminosarum TaxID=384 RepID=A0AAE2MPU7_RHILE|nr:MULTISPECIES: hypothetical protein [Rhizobium]MBB4293107.1 hypothetical protein [Rhizobium leguminosarum]MBB4300070.1 hypothetical protein [Rhizobium leguminosarum]MBB4311196.1 hypothetical protein [Rhizobium leguminosarum]MBB4435423.1 hypothetical protein [Rhizobium esperanzae]MBB4532355.1 hypothetical protein [Rhizobium leguminosarum]
MLERVGSGSKEVAPLVVDLGQKDVTGRSASSKTIDASEIRKIAPTGDGQAIDISVAHLGFVGSRPIKSDGSAILVDAKASTTETGPAADLKIDVDGLTKVAASEFGSTVPNNITHLFNPTIQAMANQFYGGDSAEVRDRFKADVKALLGPLLDKIGAGEVGQADLGGLLERLTSQLTAPGGKEVWGYRHAVQTALEGLVMGASLVSKLPANAEWDKNLSPLPSSNLASYSFNDVMAAIMIGTGLAGKGIAANGSEGARFFAGSGGDAWIAERMFGTKDNGWSKTIQALDLPYIDSEYLTSSLKKMELVMSGSDATEPVVERPIDDNDILESKVLRGYAPSTAYEPTLKKLDELKYGILGDAVKDVNREFVAPDSMDHLDQLTPEQKATLLYDLIEIKQQFNGYMNQYGDSVPDGERVGKDLDARIEKLTADPATQQHLSDIFASGMKEYLQRPENSDLLTNIEDAYLIDIGGGKAIDRALSAGKSFDDALKDYYSELNTLVDLLPQDYIDAHLGAANVTFSNLIKEHYIGDGRGVDLQPLLSGPDDTFVPGATNDAISQLANQFAQDFISKNGPADGGETLKQNLAQDIARDVDGVLRMVRGGMKLDDAVLSFKDSLDLPRQTRTPAGIDAEVYKAGLVHAVQMLSMSSVLVARGLGVGKWTSTDIAAAVGSATQIVGMTMEGLGKNLDVAGKPFSAFGNEPGSWGKGISMSFSPKTMEAAGKILGAAGGLAMAGLGFYSASRSMKAGDRAKGALEIIGGIAGTGNALIGFSEAMLYLTNAMSRAFSGLGTVAPEVMTIFSNAAKAGLAAAGLVTGLVASGVGLALGLWDMANGVKKLDETEKKLNEKLERYTGESVHLEFRPDPSFIW